jgi:hypothetical protein
MEINSALKSQYHAALLMLKQTTEKCPESIWDDPTDATKFWKIAYHALFYTHLYLQTEMSAFVPWEKHQEDIHYLSALPSTLDRKPKPGKPYTKAEVLEYLDFCWNEVEARLLDLDFEAESGFEWLKFGKLELQIYNIRHLMQHVGELSTILYTRANIYIDWVGHSSAH